MQKGRLLQEVLAALRKLGGYELHHKVLDTKDHNVPQSRARWYCVGILQKDGNKKSGFQFPQPIEKSWRAKIDRFLDVDVKGYFDFTREALNTQKLAQRNIVNADKKHGEDFRKNTWILDCDAAANRASCIKGISPCITRSRYRGH